MERTKQECVIVGAGTYGEVFSEYLKVEYAVVGFFDDSTDFQGKKVNGLPVMGTVAEVDVYIDRNPQTAIFVPIGNNEVRVNLLKQLQRKGYNTPCFIHETVVLDETVFVGKSVYILPNTVIMPFSKLYDCVMISASVNVAHHTTMEEGVFLSMGVNVGASIVIEKRAFIGISSTLMTGICRVGYGAIVGAGCVVVKDVPEHTVVAGVPAKTIKVLENE